MRRILIVTETKWFRVLTLQIILKRYICGCSGKASLLNSTHEILVLSQISQIRHIIIRGKSYSSSFWENFKPLRERLSFVLFAMVIGTVWFVALITMFARIKFIIFRMIFLFFPSMALKTSVFIRTAVLIVIYKRSWTPIRALVFRVYVKLRFSSEILPVVCKNTLISLMICFIIRAPNCFEMKHIEIRVHLKLIYQLDWNFSFWVSERAKISILAFTCPVNIWSAKLCLIFVRMIELFNSVMCFMTTISFGTFPASRNMITYLRLIRSQWPSLILFLIMIVRAPLQIVTIWINLAGMNFEDCQI